MTDMGNRAEEGILVGLESDFRSTYTYKMYLPHKNAKACSGDVSICEHVGRAVGLELGLGLGLGFFFWLPASEGFTLSPFFHRITARFNLTGSPSSCGK